MKILIAGGPKVGKTTLGVHLAGNRGLTCRHGDDLIGKLDWSEASEEISHWLDEPAPWIIEGVQVGRALRKWLSRNPRGRPADLIYHSFQPHLELNQGQTTMQKGCLTVWSDIIPELARRGVELISFENHESRLRIA